MGTQTKSFEQLWDAAKRPGRVLPSTWGTHGYYKIEGYEPSLGDDIDFYDRVGEKRYGRVTRLTASQITFLDHGTNRKVRLRIKR